MQDGFHLSPQPGSRFDRLGSPGNRPSLAAPTGGTIMPTPLTPEPPGRPSSVRRRNVVLPGAAAGNGSAGQTPPPARPDDTASHAAAPHEPAPNDDTPT